MIRKIKSGEYMKAFGTMNSAERKEYQGRVERWLNEGGRRLIEITDRPMARAQNILQFSIRWSESDVRTFADGVRLLSALVDVTETWLPSLLYAKSSGRAVRKIVDALSTVSGGDGREKAQGKPAAKAIAMAKAKAMATAKSTEATGGATKAMAMAKAKAKAMATAAKGTAVIDSQTTAKESTEAAKDKTEKADGNGRQQTINFLEPAGKSNIPVRPKHIDQYAHLLPKKTQEYAALYGPLMREMEEARENLRLLMNDPEASSTSRESWAKKVSKIDSQVKAIREALDREWAKLVEQGRVVVDDFGQAHVVPDAGKEKQTAEPSGTVAEPDGAAKGNGEKDWSPEKKKRLDQLRKFLRDRRLPEKNREAYAEKFREYHDELVRDFGAEYVTKTMQENAKELGIEFAG